MESEEPVLSKSLAAETAMCLATVAVCLVVLGCNATIPRERLAGKYRIDHSYGVEQLTIRDDGTYTQEYGEKGKDLRVINKGTWDTSNGGFWDGQQLDLSAPVIVDEFGHPTDLTPSEGLWRIRIRKSWSGEIRLLVNEDVDLAFDRVK
jgi:hypothetical protein